MQLWSSTSSAARTSLIYITVGALAVIWTGVWYVYLHNNPPQNHAHYYFCAGFGLTGLTLILIGLGVGRIGMSARPADLPGAATPPQVVSDDRGQPVAVVPTGPATAPVTMAPTVPTTPVAPPVVQPRPMVTTDRRG